MSGPIATKLRTASQVGRIGAHVLYEQLRRPKPTSLAEIPPSVDALTPEWLTAALCKGHPGAWVTGVSTTSGSDGSTTRRVLRVDYNDVGQAAGLPTSVFCKSTPKFTSRAVTVPAAALECEALFYDRIRPGLDLDAPHGYYLAVDNRSGRSMFLMEDVATTRGVVFGDPTKHYIDRQRAESIVTTLATLHGTLWESPRFAGDLAAVKDTLRWQTDVNDTIAFPKRTVIGFDRAVSVFPAAFRTRRDEIFDALMASLALHRSAPTTLLHSDVHSRNWYLTPDGGMGLYDWQLISRGSWAMDVAYALSSALTVEDRRAWERDLIALYTDRLAAAGGPQLPAEDAWLTYRQQPFHGLVFWLYTIGAGRMQPAMQPDEVSLANLERMTNMIVDLDSFEALGR
ncbi:aminoglycoside phosphotransferase (APT) family kinase protein [Mycolicibacterium sp. BK556]|uniref:aminoglycoside phosphotransferase family protein n=1 Tax=Mycobacteriaceae TaxID=1762 RepID=UPI0010E71AF8|nr:aminoglycoside phosphotransferase family protein [Mycobacterium sp. BK086]MBB3600608.1 aminoglycoside phosphotransferase (APT) family kinase protein [Mycolicibacterium sp. BK556]MBB3630361.1 aminoglycoside phosphotransferase (APT) family kinase protein [Mycolicibacterium sp. BK607]MBB3748360.1 aminoglycoside phosphotransferase (APT) family kinase protein [Mycolicibacterium sp. BK634]TDO10150.1 phosphotransferase family enzyme [Mycobacterium sp. BK086]